MVNPNSIDIVGQLAAEHQALIELLPPDEISLRISADAIFRKTLLLSAASYFEVRLAEAVTTVFLEVTDSDALVESVRTKAVARRYHDWFDWDRRNANKFFGAFGNNFRAFMDERIQASEQLGESIRAFMEIGSIRNQLVHRDFASFPLEKTVSEIFELYQTALGFVDAFPDRLREYLNS